MTTNPDQKNGWRYLGSAISLIAALLRASAALVCVDPLSDRRLRWKSIIIRAVLAESTFHWLATVVEVPAMNKAQDIPISPSPEPTCPRAVWQADKTAKSA